MYVNKLVSTRPTFTIIGLLLGLATGIYGMVTVVKKFTGAGEE
ncbi:AtpZ/AtpI family protein [Ornithinibacillus sp. 16A2E]|jgi:ATP synthase protein I|uniref:AtpZ/AtpI family protein n=1 Tax=Ornithinibacillus xuwenensis TaxID=3144668 RepID=A0ABU9XG87_9BACI